MLNNSTLSYLLVAVLISACAGTTSTETQLPIVDGGAYASIYTWNDINGNGIYEKSEFPLPYVTASMEEDVLTNTLGWANPSAFLPGCETACWKGFVVCVKVPPGFKATTPTCYSLIGDKSSTNYYFGFQVIDNVTFFPGEPDWYKAFVYRGAKVLAFHYDQNNGQLEIALDQDGTVIDNYVENYYPEDSTGKLYPDIYFFDIIEDLNSDYDIYFSTMQITLMPDGDRFSCELDDFIMNYYEAGIGSDFLFNYCNYQE